MSIRVDAGEELAKGIVGAGDEMMQIDERSGFKLNRNQETEGERGGPISTFKYFSRHSALLLMLFIKRFIYSHPISTPAALFFLGLVFWPLKRPSHFSLLSLNNGASYLNGSGPPWDRYILDSAGTDCALCPFPITLYTTYYPPWHHYCRHSNDDPKESRALYISKKFFLHTPNPIFDGLLLLGFLKSGYV